MANDSVILVLNDLNFQRNHKQSIVIYTVYPKSYKRPIGISIDIRKTVVCQAYHDPDFDLA